MLTYFIGEVLEAGGEIVDIVSYGRAATDFKQQTYDLIHMTPEMLEALENDAPEAEEYPEPPFDALFIPDYADKVEMIAPQLVFYGLKDTTLLGINGWNSPELARKAGRFLKDAVFVDAFFGASMDPEVRQFAELYRQTYQSEPNVLAAQAFDTAMLMFEALSAAEVESREDLRQMLSELQFVTGTTGTIGFADNGDARKQLYLLQFRRGQVVEYSEPEPELEPEQAPLMNQ